MKLIELAAQRLEALQRSGVAMPWLEPVAPAPTDPALAEELPSIAAARLAARAASATPRPLRRVTLDLERLQAEGRAYDMRARTPLAESFRRIKRPLLRNLRAGEAASAGRRSMILVTSALPGEGKTFCALHLALSLAVEVGLRVLLVDADVVHPQLLARLGLDSAERGLLDLLGDERLEPADVMLQTEIEPLVLLPAGVPQPLSTELLAGPAMARLLQRLGEQAPSRLIVFDAPPLLATSEAAVLAAQMGQVLVVVEAARTPSEAAAQAFELLAEHPLVMSILNKSRRPARDRSDGYYDGSAYDARQA